MAKYKKGDKILYTYTDSYSRKGMFIIQIDGKINEFYRVRLVKAITGTFGFFLGGRVPRDHIDMYSRKLAQDLNTEFVDILYGD